MLADLSAAAGNPAQAIEMGVYPEYAFLAYRDPANPGNIDRRMWRDGDGGRRGPNPIDDRVNADTEPRLFPLPRDRPGRDRPRSPPTRRPASTSTSR